MDYNRIAQILAEKTQKEYKDDIAAIVLYGAYADSEAENSTDVQFYYVPKTEKGASLCRSFLIKGHGFSFGPYTWAQLEACMEGDRRNVSRLLDAKLIYAADPSVVARFEDLRSEASLCTNPGERALALLSQCKENYFQFDAPSSDAVLIALDLFQTISCILLLIHGTYLKGGICGMKEEVLALESVPECYAESCDRIVANADPKTLKNICRRLIEETEPIVAAKTVSKSDQQPVIVAYPGVYERAKILYEKITEACFAGKAEVALFCAAQLQNELDEAAKVSAEAPQLPNLLDLFYRKELTSFAVSVYSHEANLIGFLLRNGVPFTQYANIERFEETVLS